MALSAERCIGFIRHALRGKPDPAIGDFVIINMAGQHWQAMHPWKALCRPPYLITQTADTPTFILPPDFGSAISLRRSPGASVPQFAWSDLDTVARARAEAPAGLDALLGYVAQGGQDDSDQTTPVPGPQIEIYPTPTSTISGAYTLHYRARFREVSKPQDIIGIPDWGQHDLLFIEILRALAIGWESLDTTDPDATTRLELVNRSSVFMRAKEADARIQPYYGGLRGGAAEKAMLAGPAPYGGQWVYSDLHLSDP